MMFPFNFSPVVLKIYNVKRSKTKLSELRRQPVQFLAKMDVKMILAMSEHVFLATILWPSLAFSSRHWAGIT